MSDDKDADSKNGNINNKKDDQGNESNSKKTNADKSNFDVSNIGDEDFEKVFDDPRVWNHPRFKQLNERAKKASELEKQQAEIEKTKLKEQEKFKELSEKLEQEKTEISEKYKNTLVDMSIQSFANKFGAVDADAVTKLINRKNIAIEENGEMTGVEEAMKALQSDKPYLFGEEKTMRLSSGTNPGVNNQSGKRFKLSQVQDTEFFRANEADIMVAFQQGTIENDLAR